jgi:hypothetical protein
MVKGLTMVARPLFIAVFLIPFRNLKIQRSTSNIQLSRMYLIDFIATFDVERWALDVGRLSSNSS